MAKSENIKKKKVCKVEGCTLASRCKGMCDRHYQQVHRKGYTYGNIDCHRLSPNTFRIDGEITYIETHDRQGYPGKVAIIDTDKLNVIKHLKWGSIGNGYMVARINYNGKPYKWRLHHAVMGIAPGECQGPQHEIDHINRNPLDNRIQNLRIGTHVQNMANLEKTTMNGKPCRSKFKGVTWDARGKKWRAQLFHNGVRLNLGGHVDEIDAAKAYDEKALELYEDYALTNEMMGLFQEEAR